MTNYRINVYERDEVWYAAVWADGSYDTCFELFASDRDAALAEAQTMPLRDAGSRTVEVVQ